MSDEPSRYRFYMYPRAEIALGVLTSALDYNRTECINRAIQLYAQVTAAEPGTEIKVYSDTGGIERVIVVLK